MKKNNRRNFIKQTSKAGIALALANTLTKSIASDKTILPLQLQQQALPYAYNALEPAIDALTMEIHYSKHASAYTKNANDAIALEVKDTNSSLEQLLSNISKYSAKLRNNAGGHFNHEMFWQCMSPKPTQIQAALQTAINNSFGSTDNLKNQFADAAKSRFGSGWAWLILNDKNQLKISSTPNQDNPLMDIADIKGKPILCLDVWEHAYYLKYQQKRADYITNWWNVVNWDFVAKQLENS